MTVCSVLHVPAVKFSDAGVSVTSGLLLVSATLTVPVGCFDSCTLNVSAAPSFNVMLLTDAPTCWVSVSSAVYARVADGTLS